MNDLKSFYKRINTLNLLLQYFDEENLTNKYPSLIPVLESIRKKLHKVSNLTLPRPTPMSNAKKQFRRRLATAAYSVSCGVYAYAQITRNVALKNAIHYSFSDFYRPTETVMLGRCRQVLNAVRRIKNPADFAIFPELIKTLEDSLEAYINFMSVPSGEIKRHARTMRVAKTLLDQCLSILQHQLDPLIVVIGCTDVHVFRSYRARRRIEKPTGRRRKYIKSGKYKKIKTQPASKPTTSLQLQHKAFKVIA